MSIKDRFEEWWISSEFTLSKNQFIAAVVLAAIIGVGWLYYYLGQGVSSGVKIEVGPAKQSSSAAENKVLVHVAGAVKKPGVYRLKNASRVIEAIKMAGGFTKDADQDSLNLASKVADAQKILVPSKIAASNQPGFAPDGMVNLNTATAEHLDELPGIGETMAKRILEHRQEIGSFSKIDQLKDIEGIGPKKFAKLKDKVTL